jgi:hypothetical protein
MAKLAHKPKDGKPMAASVQVRDPRPSASQRFFAVYEELARPFDGWGDQAQLLRIWDLFRVIAHGLDTWGAAGIIRTLIAPFRHGTTSPGATA